MSNSLGIGAVTATLRDLLSGIATVPDLEDTTVTTRPLDQARENGNTAGQLNVFLHLTLVNGAWRNMDLPQQVKSGETVEPPLPVNLYYLITAYGRNNDDVFAHRILGQAMSILHDHPVLSRAEIQAALPGNDLHEQIERVRITPQSMSVDEMSKLWTTFQTQYRISAAYQAAVVLIESTRPAKTPLPVLARAPGDQGATAQADLIPPFPALKAVILPNRQPAARLGEVLTIRGHHLEGDNVVVRFANPRLENAIVVVPQPGRTATEMTVQLPDDLADWVAGAYTLSAVISRAEDQERATNELPFSLAPRILNVAPNPAPRAGNGEVELTLTCSPQVRPGQRAALLLGDREVRSQPLAAPTDRLEFRVTAAVAGEHFIRLRLDGVDSLLVDRSVTPPVFDPTQKVTIQ